MQHLNIFKSALKLIREGRFGLLPMAEIGYHARVSAITVETLFETRDKLINALGEHVYNEINTIIKISLNSKAPFEERFFRLWDALLNHYTGNPDVAVFVDRYSGTSLHTDTLRTIEKENRDLLTSFFAESDFVNTVVTPAMMATLFHQNVRIAAFAGNAGDGATATALARIIFNGLKTENHLSRNSLEAA